MWQQWITGLIVALAAAYMVWRWLPAGLRKKLGRVHPAMAQSAGCGSGGGGGCSSCGGCSSSVAPRATVHAAEGQERF